PSDAVPSAKRRSVWPARWWQPDPNASSRAPSLQPYEESPMNPTLERWFCRIYLFMLYTYPRPFRLRFGGEMQQVFRDRCRHVPRASSRLPVLCFAFRTAADWLATAIRERFASTDFRAIWAASRKHTPRGFVV